MHESEEHPAHHETEAGEGHHRRRIEITVGALHLELAPLLQNAAVQKITQPLALGGGLHQRVEGIQPDRKLRFLWTEYRLQNLRDVVQVEIGIFQSRRSTEREVLNEQEVNLVAVARCLDGLVQMMGQQVAKHRFIGQSGGLKELPQLMHLDLRVDLLEPAVRLLHGLL